MRVLVDGVPVLDSSHPPADFQQLTAVFVASGATAVVRFENDSPDGDNSFFVDQVSVTLEASGGGALSCQFETGDGIGGSETNVGDAPTREDCVAMVHSSQPTANGVTYSAPQTGTACYAEFGMSGNSGAAAWQTCLLTGAGAPPPPALPTSLGLGQGEVNGCDWSVGLATGGSAGPTGQATPVVLGGFIEAGSGGAPAVAQLLGNVASGAECASMVSSMAPTANAASFYQGGGVGAGRAYTGDC